jgi:hypothetical protein
MRLFISAGYNVTRLFISTVCNVIRLFISTVCMCNAPIYHGTGEPYLLRMFIMVQMRHVYHGTGTHTGHSLCRYYHTPYFIIYNTVELIYHAPYLSCALFIMRHRSL